MARPDRLIAVFDSGLGGISVLRELLRQMPCEQFLYFGDSANAPYGSRPTAEVRALTMARIGELMPRGLKAVVVAIVENLSTTYDVLGLTGNGASRDILPLPCPELVRFVEKGLLDGPEVEDHLRTILAPALRADVGAIVLGCTHFPFLKPVLRRIVGPEVRFFDGSEGTSAQTRRLLSERGALRSEGELSVTLENSLGTAEILDLSARLLDYDY